MHDVTIFNTVWVFNVTLWDSFLLLNHIASVNMVQIQFRKILLVCHVWGPHNGKKPLKRLCEFKITRRIKRPFAQKSASFGDTVLLL